MEYFNNYFVFSNIYNIIFQTDKSSTKSTVKVNNTVAGFDDSNDKTMVDVDNASIISSKSTRSKIL